MTSKERKLWEDAIRILRQNSVDVEAPATGWISSGKGEPATPQVSGSREDRDEDVGAGP